ncbi:predicted protein [Naegleria gruberi]|uniref:Predicted protein n=1 Tax=Naegleria gruberi TaxID=5762 RepID=D2VWL7_NAEGR|nr:uncharacterized protein NAEGRDRAFT_73424 [Naegleria gruberi]EFC38717.1 predicted protein [Naegleria gruberi]|eukprot:XP_002671461.1 predicted protein [Naegleria gruberi strain NEG-M]
MNIFKTKLLGTNYTNNSNNSTTPNTVVNPSSNNNSKIKKERIVEIPSIGTNQQPSTSNYVTTQKELFIAENEKRKAEEEVLKIKKQIEEEKSKLKQVQQIKKEELKSIKQNQQM